METIVEAATYHLINNGEKCIAALKSRENKFTLA